MIEYIDFYASYDFFIDHLGWMLLAIFIFSSFTDFFSRHRVLSRM